MLQSCSSEQRAAIIHRLADLLQDRQADILAANEKDLQEGAETLSSALYSRLTLSPAKLNSLSQGLHQLAGLFKILCGDTGLTVCVCVCL